MIEHHQSHTGADTGESRLSKEVQAGEVREAARWTVVPNTETARSERSSVRRTTGEPGLLDTINTYCQTRPITAGVITFIALHLGSRFAEGTLGAVSSRAPEALLCELGAGFLALAALATFSRAPDKRDGQA